MARNSLSVYWRGDGGSGRSVHPGPSGGGVGATRPGWESAAASIIGEGQAVDDELHLLLSLDRLRGAREGQAATCR